MVGGCATLDRAYREEVTMASAPVVQAVTNTVVFTNTVERVVERTNVVLVTNAATGAVTGYATREPVATNLVTVVLTNLVPVFYTNLVQVPVTNLVAKPEVEATIEAGGSILNTFLPGIGSMLALALGGLYHGYRQVRNRKVNEALIQGVETARAVLETTPQGQAADAQFVKWLMEHQKEAGVGRGSRSAVPWLAALLHADAGPGGASETAGETGAERAQVVCDGGTRAAEPRPGVAGQGDSNRGSAGAPGQRKRKRQGAGRAPCRLTPDLAGRYAGTAACASFRFSYSSREGIFTKARLA
jgi:hypothetical protein